jgi:hypothetical protein
MSLLFSQNLITAITGTQNLPPEIPQKVLSRLYTPQTIRPGVTYFPGTPVSPTEKRVVHSTYFSVSTGYSTSYYTAEEIPMAESPLGENRMSVNLEESRQRIRNAAGGVGVIDLEWMIP